MTLWYDTAAVAANEAAATLLHHGDRQTGRQVVKYAAKMVAKNCAKFGDILDFIIYHNRFHFSRLDNIKKCKLLGQRLNEASRLKKLM